MKKILCILAILALFVPAVVLAQTTVAATDAPTDTGALPDSVLTVVSDVTDHLALAYATHDCSGLDDYMAVQEQQLLQAIGTTDKNDVMAMAHVDLVNQTALAKVMVRSNCLDKKLEADVNIHLNDEGQRRIDVRLKGDITEQQKAYVEGLFQKIQYRMPGTIINVKYL